jgi:integrase
MFDNPDYRTQKEKGVFRMKNMELEAKMEEKTTNTKKAYTSDLAYIRQWAQITFGNLSLPMTEGVILLFITDHLQGMEAAKEEQLMSSILKNGYKAKPGLHSLATVRRRLSALSWHHKELGYEDPCSGNTIKHFLYTISKTERKTIQQQIITRNTLEKLLAICDDSVKGIRDKTILLLAWTSGRMRRSEIAAAQVEHLTNRGDDFLLNIPANNFKGGVALDVPVKGSAAQALRDWLAAADIRQGAIFRSVNKRGKVSNNPLSPIDINRVVKNCCKAAGLNEKQFGAHSLRSGFLMQNKTKRMILTDFLPELSK